MLGFLIHRVGRVGEPLLQLVVRDVGPVLADERENLMRHPAFECFGFRFIAADDRIVKSGLVDEGQVGLIVGTIPPKRRSGFLCVLSYRV